MAPLAKAQGRPDPRRCRSRDPHHPQRPPAAWRHARRLQRRQVPARAADRRAAARPQGSREGGLGAQRAASRLRPRFQGRQGRSHRHAGGGGSLGEARPRGRVEAVDRLARSHRPAPLVDSRRRRPRSRSRTGSRTRRPRCASPGTARPSAIGGDVVARTLLETEPRIALSGGGGRGAGGTASMTGVSVTPYMMAPGDERIVADRLHAVISKPPARTKSEPATPAADLSGQWDVQITYAASLVHACAAPAPARPRDRRRAPRRLRDPRRDAARSTARRCGSAARSARSTATRSRSRFTGTVDRRRDGRHPRHGRIPGRDVDGEAPTDAARIGDADREGSHCSGAGGDDHERWSAPVSKASQPPRPRNTTCCSAAATSSTPKNGISAVRDVAIAGGKVAAVAERIDPAEAAEERRCRRALRHARTHRHSRARLRRHRRARARTPATTASIPTASRFRVGVTTVVDAGGAGWRNFEDFKTPRHRSIAHARARVPQHRRQRHARRQVRAGPRRHGGQADRRDGAASTRA